uniref:Uncharacterized protein n=1 Tax=Anguilla anguilla TaxID=7936 RepID=A0A0E9XLI7_ANGAN
MGLYSSDR